MVPIVQSCWFICPYLSVLRTRLIYIQTNTFLSFTNTAVAISYLKNLLEKQSSFANMSLCQGLFSHDDVIKWKHFPRYWPFVRGIHRSPVNSPHKDQWRGALMFTLICARINGWVNNGEAGDLIRNRAHYDVIVMPVRQKWLIKFIRLYCTGNSKDKMK